MGKKNLLRTINITDSSSSLYRSSHPDHSDSLTAFTRLDLINVVYDEEKNLVEVFQIPFEDIQEDFIGFTGEFNTNGTYGAIQNSVIDGTTLSFSNVRSCYEIDNTLLVVDDGNNNIRVINSITQEDIATFNTDLTNPIDIWVIESTNKGYILDNTDEMIYVVDVSDTSNITRLSDEDIDLSALLTIKDFAFDEVNGKVHVVESSNVHIFDLATQSEDSNYTPPSTPSFISLDVTNDRTYVSSLDGGSNTVFVYETSTSTRQNSEEFSLGGANGIGKIKVDESGRVLYSGLSDTAPTDEWISTYDIVNKTMVDFASGTTGAKNGLEDSFLLNKVGNKLFVKPEGTEDIKIYPLGIFPSALVHPLALDRISDNIGLFWESYETDYGFVDGENYTYFKPIPAPPYCLKRSLPLSSIDANDVDLPSKLTATIKSYSAPTGKRTQNGVITLLATGGTPPYTYQAIGQDGRNEDPQSSAAFTSLNAGNYEFRVTDSNKVNFDLPKFTLPYRATSFDSYGLIYTHQFTDVKGSLTHRIRIYDRDSSDNNTDIDAGIVPFIFSTQSQGDDIYDMSILASSLDVTLIASSLSTYMSFAEADEERYGIIWSIDDGGGTFNERFRGYMLPESYSQEFGQPPLNVRVAFSDKLGDLKNIPYANRDQLNLNVNFTGGEKSQLDLILYCLKQLNMDMDGIRVAIDWVESNHASTSTDTPLEQTYVDTDTYIKRDDDFKIIDSWNLEEVVTAILEPYSATLLAWKGYYWIVKQENWLEGTSFNYVEFDMDGVQQSTGSQTNYVDFDTATSTNRWRWRDGKQSLSTTRIYRDVRLTLETSVIEEGLTNSFIRRNLFALGVLGFRTFVGFQFIRGNKVEAYATTDERKFKVLGIQNSPYPSADVPENTKLRWTIQMRDLNNSTTKIVTSDNIRYSGTDFLNVKLRFQTRPTYSQGYTEPLIAPFPYITMKWRLKVGSYFYNQQDQSWSTTNTINQYFITEYGKDLDVDFSIKMRDTGVVTETYKFEVFTPTAAEYNITNTTSEVSMLTSLKALTTTTLDNGTRRICRYRVSTSPEKYFYYFYELLEELDSGTEPDVVEPDDYSISTNDKRWRFVEKRALIEEARTTTEFLEIGLRFLPNGQEVPKEIPIEKAANTNNKVTLERSLRHFDSPKGINNASKLYYNNLRYDTVAGVYIDTLPTSSWTDGGNARRIQNHRLDWLVRLAKKGRSRINGAIDHDIEISPLQILRDPNDDNTRYFINGGSWDAKNNQITGEFIELGSDTAPTLKSVDSSADTTESGE